MNKWVEADSWYEPCTKYTHNAVKLWANATDDQYFHQVQGKTDNPKLKKIIDAADGGSVYHIGATHYGMVSTTVMYLYTITHKLDDGSIEKSELVGCDDGHAYEEATYECDGEIIDVVQGEVADIEY